MTKRMRGLVDDLTQLLEDDDPTWYVFGLNPPAAPETPDQVEGLAVTPGPDVNTFADWDDTPRADRYHVEIQVVGVDSAFRRIATVTQSDATITGLPSGPTVRAHVIAVNDAGDGPRSDVVEVLMPVPVGPSPSNKRSRRSDGCVSSKSSILATAKGHSIGQTLDHHHII